MPDNIGERFLDDPEGGLIDGGRQALIIRAIPDYGHFSTGRAQPIHQGIEPTKSRRWTASLIRVRSEDLKCGSQLGQRLTAGLLDRLEGVGYSIGTRLLGALLVQQVKRHSSLHGDHGKTVAYHVMDVACDPQSFLVGVATTLLPPDVSFPPPSGADQKSDQGGYDGDGEGAEQSSVEGGVEESEKRLPPVPSHDHRY